jgi:hypothetical protein
LAVRLDRIDWHHLPHLHRFFHRRHHRCLSISLTNAPEFAAQLLDRTLFIEFYRLLLLFSVQIQEFMTLFGTKAKRPCVFKATQFIALKMFRIGGKT